MPGTKCVASSASSSATVFTYSSILRWCVHQTWNIRQNKGKSLSWLHSCSTVYFYATPLLLWLRYHNGHIKNISSAVMERDCGYYKKVAGRELHKLAWRSFISILFSESVSWSARCTDTGASSLCCKCGPTKNNSVARERVSVSRCYFNVPNQTNRGKKVKQMEVLNHVLHLGHILPSFWSLMWRFGVAILKRNGSCMLQGRPGGILAIIN